MCYTFNGIVLLVCMFVVLSLPTSSCKPSGGLELWPFSID